MLGFTRNTGPLTNLARRSPAAMAVIGAVIGLMVQLLYRPVFTDVDVAPGVFEPIAMTILGGFLGWRAAIRVRRRDSKERQGEARPET